MYEADAKMAAYQTQALQGSSVGYQNASPPPQPAVAHALLTKLEQIQQALNETRNRQKSLLARLHGERPEKECGPVSGGLGGSGVLGEIDQRINTIVNITKDIIENQSTLDRLA